MDRISTIISPSQDYNFYRSTCRIKIWLRGLEIMSMKGIMGNIKKSFANLIDQNDRGNEAVETPLGIGLSIYAAWVGYIICSLILSIAYISSFYFLLSFSLVFIRISQSKTTDAKLVNA